MRLNLIVHNSGGETITDSIWHFGNWLPITLVFGAQNFLGLIFSTGSDATTDFTKTTIEAFKSEGSAMEGDLYSFEYPDSKPDWYPDEYDYEASENNEDSQSESTHHSELDTQIIDNNDERNVSKDEKNEKTLIHELDSGSGADDISTVDGEYIKEPQLKNLDSLTYIYYNRRPDLFINNSVII